MLTHLAVRACWRSSGCWRSFRPPNTRRQLYTSRASAPASPHGGKTISVSNTSRASAPAKRFRAPEAKPATQPRNKGKKKKKKQKKGGKPPLLAQIEFLHDTKVYCCSGAGADDGCCNVVEEGAGTPPPFRCVLCEELACDDCEHGDCMEKALRFCIACGEQRGDEAKARVVEIKEAKRTADLAAEEAAGDDAEGAEQAATAVPANGTAGAAAPVTTTAGTPGTAAPKTISVSNRRGAGMPRSNAGNRPHELRRQGASSHAELQLNASAAGQPTAGVIVTCTGECRGPNSVRCICVPSNEHNAQIQDARREHSRQRSDSRQLRQQHTFNGMAAVANTPSSLTTTGSATSNSLHSAVATYPTGPQRVFDLAEGNLHAAPAELAAAVDQENVDGWEVVKSSPVSGASFLSALLSAQNTKVSGAINDKLNSCGDGSKVHMFHKYMRGVIRTKLEEHVVATNSDTVTAAPTSSNVSESDFGTDKVVLDASPTAIADEIKLLGADKGKHDNKRTVLSNRRQPGFSSIKAALTDLGLRAAFFSCVDDDDDDDAVHDGDPEEQDGGTLPHGCSEPTTTTATLDGDDDDDSTSADNATEGGAQQQPQQTHKSRYARVDADVIGGHVACRVDEADVVLLVKPVYDGDRMGLHVSLLTPPRPARTTTTCTQRGMRVQELIANNKLAQNTMDTCKKEGYHIGTMAANVDKIVKRRTNYYGKPRNKPGGSQG